MIDEVHFLHETRGATLEVIISRVKQNSEYIRLVALSATVSDSAAVSYEWTLIDQVPNVDDVARWLGPGKSSASMSGTFGKEVDKEGSLAPSWSATTIDRMPKAHVHTVRLCEVSSFPSDSSLGKSFVPFLST